MSSSTSDPSLVTPQLEARFDFFGLGTATIGASSTRGSIAVVVSMLASLLSKFSSRDTVEIVSFLFRLFVRLSFVLLLVIRS